MSASLSPRALAHAVRTADRLRLNRNSLLLLLSIQRDPHRNQGDFAKELGFSTVTSGTCFSHLEALDFIARTTSRQGKFPSITPRGRAALSQILTPPTPVTTSPPTLDPA